MVHIKEIRMTGWKSYGPGTVRMPLAKGFTVIVGPNGSGKSNSIDGVNFCLGTLSSKSMRADKMVSLIYNGIGGKKAAERAIVEIVFDNSDYAIPIKEKEVIVSRELKRNGSTTYRLNGKRTTRTDILDKLRIAGIDVINSYNIIAQGQVSEIVGMNPIQRRKLMENLAGVGQFDDKKKSALSELDEANRRMDELQLLVNEVAKRVSSLRKEKEDAERWNQLDQEIISLKTLLVSYDYYKYHGQITRFDEEITSIRNEQGVLVTERKDMNDKIEAVVEKIKNLENQLIRLETEVKEIRGAAEEKNIEKTKVSEKIEYNKKTINSNENRLTQLRERIDQTQKMMEEDIKTKEQLEEAKKEIHEKIEETQQLKNEIEAELEQKSSLYEDIKNEYEDATRRLKVEENRLNKSHIQFEVSRSMVTALENNVKEYAKRKTEMEEKIKTAQEKSIELQNHIEENSLQLEEAKSKIGDIDSKKNKIDETIETYDHQLRELNDKYLVQKAQADTISSFLKAESGKENPAVSFITERMSQEELQGVLGPFQNLSDEGKNIPPEVGHLADAIITDSVSTALTCINLLKKHAIGAANFIPLEKFKLKPDDKFDKIVKKIREQNIVASTIEEAANIWRKSTQTISTTDGDIFYSNGVIFGGFHLVSAQESVNKLQEEMKTTKEKISEITAKLREERENKNRILQLEKIITESITKLEKNIRDSSIAFTQQSNELKLYKDTLKKIEEDIIPLQAQLDEKLSVREEQQKEIDFYEQSLEKISLEISDVEARLEAADTRPIFERLNKVEKKLGELQGKFSGIDSRIEGLITQKKEREHRLNEIKEEVNTVEIANANLNGEIQVLAEQLSSLETQLVSILEKEDDMLEKIKDVKSDLNTQKKYQGQLVKDKEKLNQKIAMYEEKITELKLQRERVSVELEKIQKEASEGNIQLLPKDSEELERVNEKKISDEINRKTEEKKRLEPVNMKALKEFQHENSRYIELLDRRDILIEERQVILDFIEEIETEKFSVFMKVFNSVNKHFGRIFNELSGGNARLILEKDPKKGEDIFEGGLYIEAHPAGKKVASIEAMSGGEKALTALAFIFAVQTVDAQPFYILDEIDAALDPMNVRRVAKLLHRMSRTVGQDESDTKKSKGKTPGAQFLVISHRDILMAWADRLYGCTNVKGLSSIFSIQMSEDKQLERAESF